MSRLKKRKRHEEETGPEQGFETTNNRRSNHNLRQSRTLTSRDARNPLDGTNFENGSSNGLEDRGIERASSITHRNSDHRRPSAIYESSSTAGRDWTVSIAVPSSIMLNCPSHELQTILAGGIARACAVFCVDEIVIYEDGHSPSHRRDDKHAHSNSHDRSRGKTNSASSTFQFSESNEYTGLLNPGLFFTRILTYMETPPPLRRALFPFMKDLRFGGLLPSLDMPHHARATEWTEYREGVIINVKEAKSPQALFPPRPFTVVDTGLSNDVFVEKTNVPVSTRVTVKFASRGPSPAFNANRPLEAQLVSWSEPREKRGWYTGYRVRRAATLGKVFTESPFDDGYDMAIGTSERGTPLAEMDKSGLPSWKHFLLVYGGVAGLEQALQYDEELQQRGVDDASALFEYYVNLCPGQGSRTIRTEEAVWLGLMAFKDVFEKQNSS